MVAVSPKESVSGAERIQVFYDGDCPVCRRVMSRYLRRDQGRLLQWVDIRAADFQPRVYDRELEEFLRQVHVYDPPLGMLTATAAFRSIWLRLPGIRYRFLGILFAPLALRRIADRVYRFWARVRPTDSGRG